MLTRNIEIDFIRGGELRESLATECCWKDMHLHLLQVQKLGEKNDRKTWHRQLLT